MSRAHRSKDEVIEKLRALPEEEVDEVADFIEHLAKRDGDRDLTTAAGRLAADALRRVWDNADDAEYDRL